MRRVGQGRQFRRAGRATGIGMAECPEPLGPGILTRWLDGIWLSAVPVMFDFPGGPSGSYRQD